MTNDRLNEIIELINKQNDKLIQLMLAFQIALGENFLDYEKSVIYAHLCMIDDKLIEILELNNRILNEHTTEETNDE